MDGTVSLIKQARAPYSIQIDVHCTAAQNPTKTQGAKYTEMTCIQNGEEEKNHNCLIIFSHSYVTEHMT